MIRGMAFGYQLLNDRCYLEAAEKSADFVLTELSQADGLLLRTYRAGKSHLNAYLEDYSYLSAGLIALYEASFNPRWLREAARLAEVMIEQFWDASSSGFFFTGKAHESLIVQSKSAYDSATPSGTAMAVHSLLRLAKHLDRADFHEKAVQALSLYYHQMENAPSGSGQLLCELEFLLSTPKEIAVVGETNADDTMAVLREIHGRFLPNKILALLDPSDGQPSADASMPLTAGKTQINGQATVYVCENYACQTPTTDVGELETLL